MAMKMVAVILFLLCVCVCGCGSSEKEEKQSLVSGALMKGEYMTVGQVEQIKWAGLGFVTLRKENKFGEFKAMVLPYRIIPEGTSVKVMIVYRHRQDVVRQAGEDCFFMVE